MDTKKIRVLAFILVIILLACLAGWYWYLRTQGSALGQLSTERGFGSSVPTFLGEAGSTFENIIEGLGFQTEKSVTEEKRPRLWRVLATPGAGLGFISGATSTRLRFLERSTGYLFETDAVNGKTERLTNTLIPQVYEARFSGDGSPLIEQLDGGRVSVSSLTLHTSTSTFEQLVQVELGNSTHVVAHPKNRDILALVPDGNGSVLIRSAWDGTKPARVFSSPLQDWRIHWLSDESIVLVQPPASGIPGNAYRLQANNLTPLVRGVPGLTILPRAQSGALLVGSDSGIVSLGVRGSAASSTITVPLRTITDKCVWAPGVRLIAYCAVPNDNTSSQFLNDWYQGRVHTTDSWWKVDASTAVVEPLFSPSGAGVVDVESPVINDAGEYIAFRNAYDKSIWILRIAE